MGTTQTTDTDDSDREPGRRAATVGKAKHWAGYGWFMSFGTVLPLFVFLGSYLVNLTLVGEPVSKRLYPLGIWLSTFGQPPPGKDKLDERERERESEPGKESFIDRVRRHSPRGYLERRGKPVSTPVRVVWFVFVGWWLGAVWVLLSWSVFLLPYPFLDTVAELLAELPTVMTLEYPEAQITEAAASGAGSGASAPADAGAPDAPAR